jgi:hypothetical protein
MLGEAANEAAGQGNMELITRFMDLGYTGYYGMFLEAAYHDQLDIMKFLAPHLTSRDKFDLLVSCEFSAMTIIDCVIAITIQGTWMENAEIVEKRQIAIYYWSAVVDGDWGRFYRLYRSFRKNGGNEDELLAEFKRWHPHESSACSQ